MERVAELEEDDAVHEGAEEGREVRRWRGGVAEEDGGAVVRRWEASGARAWSPRSRSGSGEWGERASGSCGGEGRVVSEPLGFRLPMGIRVRWGRLGLRAGRLDSQLGQWRAGPVGPGRGGCCSPFVCLVFPFLLFIIFCFHL